MSVSRGFVVSGYSAGFWRGVAVAGLVAGMATASGLVVHVATLQMQHVAALRDVRDEVVTMRREVMEGGALRTFIVQGPSERFALPEAEQALRVERMDLAGATVDLGTMRHHMVAGEVTEFMRADRRCFLHLAEVAEDRATFRFGCEDA